MQRLTLDVEAGQISRELVRRGKGAKTRVHVLVEISHHGLQLASVAPAAGAFDFLADEPDLYDDNDLVERAC